MAERKRLGEMLLESGLIFESDLKEALKLQVGGNRRLGYLLIKMGFISEEQLHGVLSDQLNIPRVKVEDEFSTNVKKLLPKYLCNKYSVIPLSYGKNNVLTVGMVDPSDSEAVSDIERYTGKVVRPVLATKSDISSGIKTHIPWSLRDIFNAQTSNKITAVISLATFFLIIFSVNQYLDDRNKEKFGSYSKTASVSTYENHELILGFDGDDSISLMGRGAHSQGYYSVSFESQENMHRFIEAKKSDFSKKQLEWLSWAMSNPHK